VVPFLGLNGQEDKSNTLRNINLNKTQCQANAIDVKSYFNLLDLNKDGKLCMKEATKFLIESQGNQTFIENNLNWFKQIDTNNDKFIQINQYKTCSFNFFFQKFEILAIYLFFDV